MTAVWDPAKHPRHLKGREEGGRFRSRGALGTVKDITEGMAASLTRKGHENLHAKTQVIRDLPVPDPGPQGYAAGESIHAGPFSIYRVSTGTFTAVPYFGRPGTIIHRDTADELIAACDEMLDIESIPEAAANWKKRLGRGKMHLRGSSPRLFELYDAIQAHNDSSPAWTDFADRWGLDEQPILLKESGMREFGKDVLTNGFFDADIDRVFLSGDMMLIGRQLVEKKSPELPAAEQVRAAVTRYGEDHTVRHEFAHQAWYRMSDSQRAEFMATMPQDKPTLLKLSEYAGAAKEFYREESFDQTRTPWQGEVFAELVAEVTAPDYDPIRWPRWVRELGVWVLAQESPG